MKTLGLSSLVLLLAVGCSTRDSAPSPLEVSDLATRLAGPDATMRERLGMRASPWVTKDGRTTSLALPRGFTSLGVVLPSKGDEALQLDVGLSLSAVGARQSPLELVGQRAIYRDVYPSTDSVVLNGGDWVEQLWVLRGPDAPRTFELAAELSGKLHSVRSADEGSLEFLDAQGESMARMPRPYAIDANGKRFEAKAEWNGQKLLVTLADSKEIAWPVLLDPVIELIGWTQWMVPGPSARHSFAMAGLGTKVVLFDTGTWEWDGAGWAQKAPAVSPRPRSWHAMATLGTKVVLFGGSGPPLTGETWEWDGINWEQKMPVTSPPGRTRPAMATLGTKVVLFGGYLYPNIMGDTWEWDGVIWTQKAPATSPPARYAHSMATLGTKVVLFGGRDAVGPLGDTWEWNGTNWTQKTPATAPSARHAHSMATLGSKVILFGGSTLVGTTSGIEILGLGQVGDTWEWDGTAWTARGFSTSPPPRSNFGFATLGAKVVLFGGLGDGTGPINDTWIFRDTAQTGGGCLTNTDCESGFCADKVCCSTACAGSCDSCNLPGSVGTCAPNACASCTQDSQCSTGQYCNGAGECVAKKLAFTNAAQTLPRKACSGISTIQSQNNRSGVPFNVATNTVVTLSGLGSGSFYSDSNCTMAIGSVTIPAGGSSASFYFKDGTAGSATITAAASGFPDATQTQTILPFGAATKLSFSVSPANSVAGTALSGPVQVAIEDAFNNRVLTASSTVTLTLTANPGNATLSGTTSVAAVSGVASFPAVTLDKAGTGYVLHATSGSLTAADSDPFDIVAADPIRLMFATQPSSVVAGVSIAPAMTVVQYDAFGNVTTASGSVTLSLENAGTATASGTLNANFVLGTATFSSVQVTRAGTGYRLRAAFTGLPDELSAPFDVTPAAPSQLLFVVQPTATAAALPIAPPVEIAVADSFGNRVTDAPHRVLLSVAPPNTAAGTLSGTVSQVVTGGVATFSDLTIDRNGRYRLLASSMPALPSSQSDEFEIALGPSTQLVFKPFATDGRLAVGACSRVVTVEAQDDGSNASALSVITDVILSAPAGVSFFSDAACTTHFTSSPTIAAGASTLRFYFSATNAGDVVLSASSASLRTGTQTWTIIANPAPLALVPDQKRISPRETIAFEANGGQPPYTFSIPQNNSGGTIDPDVGTYVAGPTDNVVDTVQLSDSAGAVVSASITVAANSTGCGCNSTESSTPGLLALGLLAWWARRRRRTILT